MLPDFRNEPLTDFSDPANAAAFEEALRAANRDMGRSYPMVIGGQQVMTERMFATVNPSRPADELAYFPAGDASHVDQAIEAARCAFLTWQHSSPFERAGILHRVAGAMRRRKHEFSATMVLEVGKPWAEADADTAEAIDFLECYARQIVEIFDSSEKLVPVDGERGELQYVPLGVGAIIPPWNFPNAIFTGLVASAIAAGNAVVVKPADQSPLIAYKVAALFWECGLPEGVLNFLTGAGNIVGARMVEHPVTRFISFTGSRAVGVEIYAQAAVVHPGQKWLKRSILELGGKNAVIVDASADLDEAAEGIVAGAFGFGGQKCSAGSRAVIVESVYDQMAEKITRLASKITVGDPAPRAEIGYGPVIDAKARAKTLSYIEIGKTEGNLLTGGSAIDTPDGGYFIQPTVFGDVDPHARIAQEEIFGPVLALFKARNFDHALHIANDTDYGLTGAVYALDNAVLEQARHEFHVGNLYLNRKITGALVGVHPFGGFNMSGTDSKAGGPDYLLHFTQAKSTAENTSSNTPHPRPLSHKERGEKRTIMADTYWFKIGDIDALAVTDESEPLTPERFNGIFNRDDSQDIRDAFTQIEAPMFSRNGLYLKTPSAQIMVDTGVGIQNQGHMIERLHAAGVNPADIDILIITHFHGDHFGGMLDADGNQVFPKARVVVSRPEWSHWMSEATLAGMPEERQTGLQKTFMPYVDAAKLDMVDDGDEISPGIRAVLMPGHTPGQMGLLVTSGDAKLLHIADVAHFPVQGHFMQRIPRFDSNPEQGIATRRAVFARSADNREMLLAYHFPFPGMGYMTRDGDGFTWQPG